MQAALAGDVEGVDVVHLQGGQVGAGDVVEEAAQRHTHPVRETGGHLAQRGEPCDEGVVGVVQQQGDQLPGVGLRAWLEAGVGAPVTPPGQHQRLPSEPSPSAA